MTEPVAADPHPETCPTCDGKKTIGPVHINRGELGHEWAESIQCWLCGGEGTITSAKADCIKRGRQLREFRVSRNESLRDASRRLNVRPSELSAFETGRVDPDSWEHPFAQGVRQEYERIQLTKEPRK